MAQRPLSHRRFVRLDLCLAWLALLLLCSSAYAGNADATWKANPPNNQWVVHENWTPETRPFGPTAVATMDFSIVTSIVTAASVGTVVFTPTASAYTFLVENDSFDLADQGFVNSSGRLQRIDVRSSPTFSSSMHFSGSATAGVLTEFTIRGSSHFSREGAMIFFEGNSNAGQATFNTRGGEVIQGRGGVVNFRQNSSAADATFNVLSGSSSLGGVLTFWESSTAGAAHIFNRYGPTSEETPGTTRFDFAASAGTSTITNDGGRPGGGFTKSTSASFAGNSTAWQASITNRAALQSLGFGGRTYFSANSNAASATIVNEGAALPNTQGGLLSIYGSVTDTVNAGSATIRNQGASAPGGSGGKTEFSGTSAAQATIINESGSNGGVGGTTEFVYSSRTPTAGSAMILNKAPISPVLGGVTTFRSGTAGMAQIIADGSAVAGDSAVVFPGTDAGQSTITLMGATSAAGLGGRLQFENSGTAGQATLIAKAGTVTGAPGGRILFKDQAQGGTARAELETGALIDIGSLTSSGMTIGAIEGAGQVFLGAKSLAIGANNANALFSGTIQDGGLAAATGGSLTKVGSGTLKLAGDNLYTGLTTVSAGSLCISGSVVGNLTVNSGATLCLAGGRVGRGSSSTTIATNGTLSGFGTINGSFTNNGLVAIDGSGTLVLTGAVTNNGLIRISRGAVLEAGDASSFTNYGTLDLISGLASLPPSFVNAAGGIVLDSSVVRVKEVLRNGNRLTIVIAGYTGHTYQLQRSDRPASAHGYLNVGESLPGSTGGLLSFEVEDAAPSGFYRVAVDL